MLSNPTEPSAERIEEVFQQAWDVAGEARAELLTELCGDDLVLRASVARLLRAGEEVEDSPAWNRPAIVMEAASTMRQEAATELDRYRLLETLGAGGMGVVYKAARADDAFSKLVAIKIVHAGSGSEKVLRRFRQERQILAGLEHPNIARLLDGGETAEGLPFLVMEFVDGVPIDRYLALNRLADSAADLEQRLTLVRKICSAVSYAHRSLVVHQDLKPANVLVTPDGEPKLLDFGIAKMLSGADEGPRTEGAGMTPQYASPEQMQGGVITTASDIYSLGVLLYEALCGSRPYGETTGALELAQAIALLPPRPMVREPGGRFDLDLETIVEKALRKDPRRRYSSVDDFAEDLRRYEEGYPVTARPDTRRYRMTRFVGRNRAGVAAGVVALLVVAAGVAAIWREAQIAERRFNDVRHLANSYLFEFHDAIKDLPGATPARQLVVKRAIEFLDKLAAESSDDVALGRELATAYDRIGEIQGRVNGSSMADQQGSMPLYEKALGIRERLAAKSPGNLEVARELATSYSHAGWQHGYAGDPSRAAVELRKAVSLGEKVLRARPSEPGMREAQAEAYTALADVLGNTSNQNLGDSRGAIELYRKSLAMREKLASEAPADKGRLENLAISSSRLSQQLQALDDKPGAVAASRRAADIFVTMLQNDSGNADVRRSAAIASRNLAMSLMKMGAGREAKAWGDRSMAILEQVAADDPGNVQARVDMADGYYAQGFVRAGDDYLAARAFYERAIAIQAKLAAERPGEAPRPGLRTAYQLLTDLNIKMGDAGRAITNAENELAIDAWLLNADAKNAGAVRSKGVAFRQIGQAHELNGMDLKGSRDRRVAELVEAKRWYRLSLDVFEAQKAAGTLVPAYAGELEKTPAAIGQCDLALGKLGR